jgi:hypothetical protein
MDTESKRFMQITRISVWTLIFATLFAFACILTTNPEEWIFSYNSGLILIPLMLLFMLSFGNLINEKTI